MAGLFLELFELLSRTGAIERIRSCHLNEGTRLASVVPIILVLGFALLSPSSFAGEGRAPVRSLLEIREDRVIVQKWETSCAAAALATVLTFSHNDAVSEKAVTMAMMRTTGKSIPRVLEWLAPRPRFISTSFKVVVALQYNYRSQFVETKQICRAGMGRQFRAAEGEEDVSKTRTLHTGGVELPDPFARAWPPRLTRRS